MNECGYFAIEGFFFYCWHSTTVGEHETPIKRTEKDFNKEDTFLTLLLGSVFDNTETALCNGLFQRRK